MTYKQLLIYHNFLHLGAHCSPHPFFIISDSDIMVQLITNTICSPSNFTSLLPGYQPGTFWSNFYGNSSTSEIFKLKHSY